MEKIQLPERFQNKLDNSDKKFNAIVYEILKNFEELLNSSSLYFFPEYNNHGIVHLNNIFKIQDDLITEESFDLLTVEDITILIVATLSHDIGMHLNYEGFQTLINEQGIFSQKWKLKWDQFLRLARKYNENKLKKLFGDIQPIFDIPNSKESFSDKDRMLIGEFLRINHPTLAEDILELGFPIANNKTMKLSNLLDNEQKLLEFSALLAKSHGIHLRDTFKEVENIGYQDNLIFAHNIHIVYLMVILRLSDYLDIYKNRHPKIMLGLKNFMSEVSKFEWEKNTSITDENPYTKDKEAIFLGVEPKDSYSFINLKNFFKGIQYEFDISWAVLGEVYSRHEELYKLGIKYRRILSNIDDEITYSKKVNYLPRKVYFDSDPELLKLLIAPLYGNDPSFGVRELLQNAIDACKEYKKLSLEENYSPKVILNVIKKEEKFFFEIIDNGIGMLENTIISYFLKAGASFRNSELWKENFEDNEKKSKIERTGRFGVGLLAAFLFGNKIQVRTRHYSSREGYRFEAHLSDNQINILKDDSLEQGTSIKIEISETIYKKLLNSEKQSGYYDQKYNWKNWYFLDDINIVYNGDSNNKVLNEKNYISLRQEEYTSFKWCYEGQSIPNCILNGFKIPQIVYKLTSKLDFPYGISSKDGYYNRDFNLPNILIQDKEGKAPISLNREVLMQEEFTFNDDFVQSLSSEFFKKFINFKINKNDLKSGINYEHPMHNLELVHSKNGFNILNSWTIEKNKINKLVFISLRKGAKKNLSNQVLNFFKELINKNEYIVLDEDQARQPSYGYHYILDRLAKKTLFLDKKFGIKSGNITVPKDKYSNIFKYKNTSIKVKLKDSLTTFLPEIKKKRTIIPYKESSEYWARNYFIKEEKSNFSLNQLDSYIDDINLVVEVYLDSSKSVKNKNIEYYFYNLMEEYFKENYWIPYSE